MNLYIQLFIHAWHINLLSTCRQVFPNVLKDMAAFDHVSCPVVKNFTENGALVLARCLFQGVIIEPNKEGNCQKFLSLECGGSGMVSVTIS